MKFSIVFMALISLALMLSACAGANSSGASSLEGATWVLTGYNNTQPLAGTQLTLLFNSGQISGKAGCNQYGGSYQIQGEQIRLSEMYNTEMACQNPVGVMEQERVYLDLLRSADRFVLADDALTFFSGSSQILTFEKKK